MKKKRHDWWILYTAIVGAAALVAANLGGGCTSSEIAAELKPQEPTAKSARLPPATQEISWPARLAQLKPLSKTHWSWPVRRQDDWYTDPEHRAVALQIARICGSWGLGHVGWLHPANHEHWKQGIGLAADAGVSVNMTISPYHWEFPAPDPNPCLRNDLHQLAVTRFADNLALVKTWCDDAGVEIALVMFDHERFYTTQSSRHKQIRGTIEGERWDGCVAEKLLAFDRIARAIVPRVKLVWYGAPNKSRGQGWIGPRCDYYMPSLYYPASAWGDKNRLAYWSARTLGIWATWPPVVTHAIPCVSLASGYHPREGGGHYWRHNWDYDSQVSYDLGAWLSQETKVRRSLDSVYFYPEPSPPGKGRQPEWIPHFEAYVQGWHSEP